MPPRRPRRSKEATAPPPKPGGSPIPLDNDELKRIILDTFGETDVLHSRTVRVGGERGLRVLAIYDCSLFNAAEAAKTVFEPLIAYGDRPITRTNAIEVLKERVLTNAVIDFADTIEGVIEKILSGRVVLHPEGSRQALVCDVSQTPVRSVEEPETEGIARGPREGFVEQIEANLALLRRRLRTPHLRTESFTVGKYTQTRVVLTYIEGVASETVVAEARSRLERIGVNIDGLLVSDTVVELIEDHPFSLFPTINTTERPERVAAALLEGRFAIFVEGTPFALFAPTYFAEFFTSSADHTERPITTLMLRTVRLLSLFITLFLPSIYVALVSFHHEAIPTILLLSIALGREGVPFPPAGEAFLMEGAFEVLREAGLRLPKTLSNAVSIVGVLVIGQAAVAAKVISPIMIIIVGLTAVASFTTPNFGTADVLRFLRFPILFLTALFGAIGMLISFILLVTHLVSLRSFGVPYMAPLAPFRYNEIKKGLWRRPVWDRGPRPATLWAQDTDRQEGGLMPRPPREGEDGGKG